MICAICNCDKEPYHMMTREKGSAICFDCGGPYECIHCDVTQPSTEFRVQGRICITCKDAMKLPDRKRPAKRYEQFSCGRIVPTVVEPKFILESEELS